MRCNGLQLSYKDGVNVVMGEQPTTFPTGDLVCKIFQGETLYNISTIVKNCISCYPMRDESLTQDEIEGAERYILTTLTYDDFTPAQLLAQGSFIRCMEHYRALDSKTRSSLLAEARLQVENAHDQLFGDIGFSTVGLFLQLCFNSYYVDLINGISLFRGMSAVKSGEASPYEQTLYENLCEAINQVDAVPGIELHLLYDPVTKEFEYQYTINSFMAMALFEFSHFASTATKVVRCQNPACRKFFTAIRISAKYCYFPAPQNERLTCREFYSQYHYRQRVKNDELLAAEKRALSRLYTDKSRHPEASAEIVGLIRKIQIQSPGLREAVMSRKMTKNDYQNWLDAQRRKKGIDNDE